MMVSDYDDLIRAYACHPRVNSAYNKPLLLLDKSNISNKYWVDQYLEQLKNRVSEVTVHNYYRNLGHLINFVSYDSDLANITEDKIRDILKIIRHRRKASGVFQWVNICKKFFDYCIAVELT